jgi:hypothetical protein
MPIGVETTLAARNINIKKISLTEEHLRKLRTCRDPYLGLGLPMHVTKVPIHLVTESL